MKSILDSSFRYAPSYDTDLRRTFARVRDEQRRAAERPATPARHVPHGSGAVVHPFRSPTVRRSVL